MTSILSLAKCALFGLGVILLIFVSLFPVYYMLITSLKPDSILLQQPPLLWFTPTLENYRQLLIEDNFGRYYWNSINVAFWSTALALVLGSMMAFAFLRLPFTGKKVLFFIILIPRSFPSIAILIPIFFAVRALGLMDHVITLVLFEAAARLPFVFWIMRGFLRTIPAELIEAALLDGCSLFEAFFRIVVPLAVPGLAAVGIICFIDTWNAFLVPFVLTNFDAVTAPVALQSYAATEEQLIWGVIAAGGFLTVLPIILFAFLLHRFLLGGLTAGAVK
jgi:multiple sugar transport system permease protein